MRGKVMKRARVENLKLQRSFLVCFTLMFAAAAAVAFLPFITFKTSLVWENEGLSQYYVALIYWGKYLRAFAKGLLAGSIVLPQFDFSIGLGEDVFTTLNLYVLGDPFALLSAAVPSRLAGYFCSVLAVLRLYAAGLSFGLLAKQNSVRAPYSAFGALVYSFCGFALTQGINCQACINPLIYFPLIILGAQRIMEGKRPYVFIISVFLAAVGNIYYFVQLSVFLALFVLLSLCFKKREGKHAKGVLILLGAYILGVLCASAVLLPALSAVAKSAGFYSGRALYSLDYYLSLLPLFMSSGFSAEGELALGFSAAGLFGVILLFSSKRNGGFYKSAFCISCLFVLLPFFGRALGVTGALNNNWVWAFALLVAFILSRELQNAESITPRTSVAALAVAAALAVYCLAVKQARAEENFAQLIILAGISGTAFIYSTAAKIKPQSAKPARLLKIAMAALCVAAVCTNGLYRFAYTESSASAMRSSVQSNASFAFARDFSGANDWKSVKELQLTGSAIERYDAALLDEGDYNSAAINETYGTMAHFGFINPYVLEFQNEVQSARSAAVRLEPVGGDEYLETVENVRFFACADSDLLPDGYKDERFASAAKSNVRTDSKSYFSFYENKNYIPFGFMYKNVIDEESYAALNPAEKRIVLTKAAVIAGDCVATATPQELSVSSSALDFKLDLGSEVFAGGSKDYHTVAKNAKLTLLANAAEGEQVYLIISGAEFTPQSKANQLKTYNSKALEGLTKSERAERMFESNSSAAVSESAVDIRVNDVEVNSLELASRRSNTYAGAQSFTVNLGRAGGKLEVELNLGAIGDYRFDSIELVACGTENFASDLVALSENTVQDLKIETDKFSGTVTSDEGGWLYFSLPYSENWQAYVDGEAARIYRANTAFSAISVDGGSHKIEFEYRNRLLEKGAVISLAGFGTLAVLLAADGVVSLRKRRGRNEK